jgi:hypothetical protein
VFTLTALFTVRDRLCVNVCTGIQRLNAEQQLLLEEYYRRGKLRIKARIAQRLEESQVGPHQLHGNQAANETKRFSVLERFHVTLHPRTCVTPTGSVLDELRPRFVVLYDPSLEVRNEWWPLFLFCFVLFCFVLLCFALLCFALLCFALFCFVLACFVLFCYVMLCEFREWVCGARYLPPSYPRAFGR